MTFEGKWYFLEFIVLIEYLFIGNNRLKGECKQIEGKSLWPFKFDLKFLNPNKRIYTSWNDESKIFWKWCLRSSQIELEYSEIM